MGDHSHHQGDGSKDLASDIIGQNISEFFRELGGDAPSAPDHSSHAHHDHSTHASHNAHAGHMMKMWFHGGCEEVILFDFWRIESYLGLFISSLLIFALGALYEGIKWYRVQLQMKTDSRARQTNEIQLHQSEALLETATDDVYAPTTTPPACHKSDHKSIENNKSSAFSPERLLLAGLYVLQLVVAYWLMLIVMTYNTYLSAAVILGAGFGHWLFAVIKPSSGDPDSFAADACH